MSFIFISKLTRTWSHFESLSSHKEKLIPAQSLAALHDIGLRQSITQWGCLPVTVIDHLDGGGINDTNRMSYNAVMFIEWHTTHCLTLQCCWIAEIVSS